MASQEQIPSTAPGSQPATVPGGAAPPTPARHTIVIPPEVSMLALLGARDELLRVLEHSFPRVDVHVRGN